MTLKISSEKQEDQKEIHKTVLEAHHQEADKAYKTKQLDKELSKSDRHLKVITFDLQQILPTPYLTTGSVFYKRQLHTYNLTIHDCNINQSVHCMWHDAIAGRGANEIASCLYKYILELDDNIERYVTATPAVGKIRTPM